MYSYEIKENGFIILRYGKPYMVQLEPYIPNPSISYEENAMQMIKEIEAPHVNPEEEDLKTRMANMEIAMANMMGV